MPKIKYGLKNVHYALIDELPDGISYLTPQPIKGAVNLALSPSGESYQFYADDEEYYSANTNDGYEGDLEIALVPDQFKVDVLGEVRDSNGVLFEKKNALMKPFALLFEFKDDVKARRHVIYYCKTERTNVETSTRNKSIEVKTETLKLKCKNIPGNENVKSSTNELTPDEVYDGWYNAVYMEQKKAVSND